MLTGQAFGTTRLPDIDLTGKTVIVTGANTGLGFECAKHLARLKVSHLILACRDAGKGQAAKAAIVVETACEGHTNIDVWELNLANYRSTLAFGERVRSQLLRLDAIIANAGMELQEFRMVEDLEMHLTVNVVSTFLCALAVLPLLKRTSKDNSVETTITFAGSMYHIFGPDNELEVPENRDIFDALSDQKRTDVIWRYALSKLMVHQCFHAFAACLSRGEVENGSRVIVNLVNPGWCGTELSRAKPHPLGERISFALLGWTAEKGSRTYVHAMVAGKESHGRYLSECQFKVESAFVQSQRGQRIQKKIWDDLVRRIRKVSPEVAGFIEMGS
ncbi:NAD(P)-binding protein [Lophiostoma macrostomum CBS 122681]|uniref:NAD(P)-binding protein n=1 Tax=Lophiostoma macrostomum CBS 122681 TaxID=1314788 RepID=A0A6A6TSI9_9PLEO|nr:NAD(P)-binding protein [Lophiostoma macrostomum CBS 122681]